MTQEAMMIDQLAQRVADLERKAQVNEVSSQELNNFNERYNKAMYELTELRQKEANLDGYIKLVKENGQLTKRVQKLEEEVSSLKLEIDILKEGGNI